MSHLIRPIPHSEEARSANFSHFAQSEVNDILTRSRKMEDDLSESGTDLDVDEVLGCGGASLDDLCAKANCIDPDELAMSADTPEGDSAFSPLVRPLAAVDTYDDIDAPVRVVRHFPTTSEGNAAYAFPLRFFRVRHQGAQSARRRPFLVAVTMVLFKKLEF